MALWSSRRATRKSASPVARLCVEELDSREAPSSLLTNESEPAPAGGESALVANQAPTITNFQAVVGPNGEVTFSGQVSDDQAVEGYVVRIVGDGVDVSAIVLSDGTFQVTTIVYASGDVTVSATVTDNEGATSDPVYTTFTPTN